MAESRYLVSTPEPVNVACLLVLAPVVEPCWYPTTSIVHQNILGLDPRLDQGADERVHGFYQGIDDIVAAVPGGACPGVDMRDPRGLRVSLRRQREVGLRGQVFSLRSRGGDTAKHAVGH